MGRGSLRGVTLESLTSAYGDLTADESEQLDRACSSFGIATMELMRLAGFAVAKVAWHALGEQPGDIDVVAGRGHNGGDGIIAASYLVGWGCSVRLYLTAASRENLPVGLADIVDRLPSCGAEVFFEHFANEPRPTAVVVDALTGTGARAGQGTQHEATYSWLDKAVRCVAVDVPSGLDATTGEWHVTPRRVDHVCCLAGVKHGVWLLREAGALPSVFVADIGIPQVVWDKLVIPWPHRVAGGALAHIPAPLAN